MDTYPVLIGKRHVDDVRVAVKWSHFGFARLSREHADFRFKAFRNALLHNVFLVLRSAVWQGFGKQKQYKRLEGMCS